MSTTFYPFQAAARQIVKQGQGGSITSISSVSALVGGGLQTPYISTKAAKKACLEARIPLGRVGDPEDIVGTAVFLASEKMSRYVNGSGLLAEGCLVTFSNLLQ